MSLDQDYEAPPEESTGATALVPAAGDVVEVVSTPVVEALTRAEIDRQVATAKTYPRGDLKLVLKACTEIATMDKETADSCMYALPRAGKNIEGASVRFAEILTYAWGNVRAGSRVVSVERDHVVAQGFCFDLERNNAVTVEVKRRITDRNDKRLNADMIVVTGNACAAIAYREAVFTVIPKPFWRKAYEAAVATVRGTAKDIGSRRIEAVAFCQKFGASEVQVLETLGVDRIEDMTGDHLVRLKGIIQGVREGGISIDVAFVAEWEAVKAREKRGVENALSAAINQPKTWWAMLSEKIAKVWNGGKPMSEAAACSKVELVLVQLGVVSTTTNTVDARQYTTSDMRRVLTYLNEKYPDGAVESSVATPGARSGAGERGLSPTASKTPDGTGAPAPGGTDAPAVADTPARGFDEQHADATEEAPPELEPEADPAAVAQDAAAAAQFEADGQVATIFFLAGKAKKSQPNRTFVKESPAGSGTFWFMDLGIVKALGGEASMKLQKAGAQTIDADQCRAIVKAMREAGIK